MTYDFQIYKAMQITSLIPEIIFTYTVVYVLAFHLLILDSFYLKICDSSFGFAKSMRKFELDYNF